MAKDVRGLDRTSAQGGLTPQKGGQTNMDHLHRKILARLLQDGRVSFRQLAAEMQVSTTTVATRVARLQSAGIICGYHALVDFQKLGYELTVVTEIHVSKGKLVEMEQEIAKLPNVCAVYDVTGEIDAIVISKCRNREELSRFTKSLLSMHFVERTNSHVVLSTVKEDFRLPIQP
ncbi:MAG TPA: Lrp/AsnC family transcriptional regulator [Nitrososphaerales archaeon]|nr:Lrp/AsnC family transcriptional regulator [Nitrososphaerales archaeon]